MSPLTPTYRPTTYGVTLGPTQARAVLDYIKGDEFDGEVLSGVWKELQEFVDASNADND